MRCLTKHVLKTRMLRQSSMRIILNTYYRLYYSEETCFLTCSFASKTWLISRIRLMNCTVGQQCWVCEKPYFPDELGVYFSTGKHCWRMGNWQHPHWRATYKTFLSFTVILTPKYHLRDAKATHQTVTS